MANQTTTKGIAISQWGQVFHRDKFVTMKDLTPEILKDKEYEIRLHAVRSLRNAKYIDRHKLIKEAFNDKKWQIRQEAVLVLGSSKTFDTSTIDILIYYALDDDDWRILRAVVYTLGKTKDQRVLETLQLKQNDENEKVRVAAKRTLNMMK